MFNKDLLKSKLALKGLSMKKLAEKMEMNYNTFQQKFLNRTPFRPQEIQKIQEILELTNDDVVEIFVKGSREDRDDVENTGEEYRGVKKDTILITTEEAAEYLGVGKDCVKRMTEVPDFPLIYNGNRTLLIKPKILDWLAKHTRESFGK